MAITIKNEHEIALMRESGRLLALVHEEMRKELKEGMTTKDIDQICETMIRDFGCIPNFLNYRDFRLLYVCRLTMRLFMEFLLKKDIFRMEIS